jgi:hypothetical protein
VDALTCITEAQAVTLGAIYQNWTSVNDEQLFPSYLPGSELHWEVMLGELPFQLARKHFAYFYQRTFMLISRF